MLLSKWTRKNTWYVCCVSTYMMYMSCRLDQIVVTCILRGNRRIPGFGQNQGLLCSPPISFRKDRKQHFSISKTPPHHSTDARYFDLVPVGNLLKGEVYILNIWTYCTCGHFRLRRSHLKSLARQKNFGDGPQQKV